MLERVSKGFGFQGAADMRTKLKRRTGLTLRKVRDVGGLTELFKERVLLQPRTAELERLRVTTLHVDTVGGSAEQVAR